MIFSVSKDGFEQSLVFGPDSMTLTVENRVHERTKGSPEILLSAWSLMLSERQQFLNNHLAQIRVTPNQQGSHGMRDGVLSSVGAQDMDKSEYQVSADLDVVEFYWKKHQLDVDSLFRPGIDTPFPPAGFEDLEMGGSAENPNLLDEEEDKESSPPPLPPCAPPTTTTTTTTTTPVSERPTRPPALLKTRPFGTRKENVPEYVYSNIFQKVLPCLSFNISYI